MTGATTAAALAAGGFLLVTRRYLRWGATGDEVAAALPGDEADTAGGSGFDPGDRDPGSRR